MKKHTRVWFFACLALGPLTLTPMCSAEGAYVQSPFWTKGTPVHISQGVVLQPTTLAYDRTYTNIAVLFHPLSAGSLIPANIQPWLPPESWACTIGGGYAAAAGGASAGAGCGINLLDSVRSWGHSLLSLSGNATLNAVGNQIAPSVGPLNLYVGRQWDDTQERPWRFAPRWFFGASFGF